MRAGMAGAVLCTLAGTALGGFFRERKYARLRLLHGENEMLGRLRLMLMEERLGLPQLLRECAEGETDGIFGKRLLATAKALERKPLITPEGAYAEACRLYPLYAEKKGDLLLMQGLFRQLGKGTAAMREQAVASALRRLKPVLEEAEKSARTGGRLSVQLGLLLGLMAGIVLW